VGKFSGVIAAAKAPESQIAIEAESQKTVKPENEIETKAEIQDAREQELQITGKPENQNSVLPDREVNLSIKVSEKRRMHWLIEAKKQRSSLTREITEFLSQKFGEPEE
jgi:hypothetical protein